MADTTPDTVGLRAGRLEWVGLAVLALPTLMVALDIGSLFLALPRLSADLRPTTTQQLWITAIYGFTLAAFLVTMGTLGDRIGRRKLLMIGGAAFGALSVLAAYSTSAAMLIIARGLLGIAGATLMPSTLALIRNMFRDAGQARTAISLWSACQFAGAALGPVIGGQLLAHFWWGSVFLLGVPFMLIMMMAAPLLLPEYRRSDSGRLDLASVLLSLLAILPIIYGVEELTVGGGGAVVPVISLVAGIVFAVLFTRRQLGLADPLLDLRLFGQRLLSVTLMAMILVGAVMAGTTLLLTQYLQNVLGYSPAASGGLLMPAGLAIAAGSMLAPVLLRWVSMRTAITAGLGLGVVGFLLITQVGSVGGIVLAITGLSLVHLGAGPLFTLGTGLVIGSVPPDRAGSAASVSETSANLGSTLGLALIGTIGAAVYHAKMNSPALVGVPASAVAAARETVAAAAAAAHNLPVSAAMRLLNTAHSAFSSGLDTVGIVGIVICAAMAVLIAVFQRPRAAAAPATVPESAGEAVER